jgi:hypothetical protein
MERQGPLIKSFHVEFLEGTLTVTSESGQEVHYRISRLEQESPEVQQAVERSQRDDVVTPAEAAAMEARAKETFTLTGRIKGAGRDKPPVVEGRPDGRGRPTAWTRFAAHQEGSDEAWLLSTTFHGGATRIALGLQLNDQITAVGYIRRAAEPKPGEQRRMDQYSVFHMPNHPGKSTDEP